MLARDDTLDGTYPFAPHLSRAADGFALHYADEGSGTPIVLLHGEPTWSYLYRDIIPYLATAHRVIAPDYLGFGKSDSPIGVEYTALEHVERLEALIEQLDLRDVTLVMHDWGGMIGGLVAARRPERFARLVVMNCFLPFGLPGDAPRLMRNARGPSTFAGWPDSTRETRSISCSANSARSFSR